MRSRPVSRGQPLQPFQPCIAELLRTCVHPPSLILRVERILEEEIKESRPEDQVRRQTHDNGNTTCTSTYRVYLSDGELMVQALLAAHLHPLIDLQETTEGSLIELRGYSIHKAKRQSGKGEVIYLGVKDFVCISLSRPTTREAQKDVLENGGGFLKEEDTRIVPRQTTSHIQPAPSSPAPDMSLHVSSSQDSDTFETVEIDPERVKKRRQALHELSSNNRLKRKREDEDQKIPVNLTGPKPDELASSGGLAHSNKVESNPQTAGQRGLTPNELNCNARMQRQSDDGKAAKSSEWPKPEAEEAAVAEREMSANLSKARPSSAHATAPLHTLDSLLHPPSPLPTRNYRVDVFAVISWISPTLVHTPGSPFPPKRTLKLHDPSITSRQVGVGISVFIDAAAFTPRHATIALFRGVVMQMYGDGVILNAYPTLRGSEWYIDDEDELSSMGYDVRGMRDWWEARRKEKASVKLERRGISVSETAGRGDLQERTGTLSTKE